MKDIDILIFVEHVDRELKGAKEIKRVLHEKAQLNIKIFSLEFGFFDAWIKYNPKLICLPYCKSKENLIVRAFNTRNPNTIFLNLSYEQILNKTSEMVKAPRDDFAKKELYYFAWGEFFKKYLMKYEVPEKNIFVVGKPEIYFLQQLKEEKGKVLKREIAERLGLNEKKKWCFLPLNDGPAFRDVESLKRNIETGLALPQSMVSHRFCYNQIRFLLRWLFEMSSDGTLRDYEVILRPHPGVDISAYQDVLKELEIYDFPNLHILREYTVKEWLCSSDLCISNWSTVLVDAAMIGLEAYVFEPEPLDACLDAEWLRGFTSIDNIDNMKKIFINIAMEQKSNQQTEKMFFDITISPIEAWADSMIQILNRYHEAVTPRMFANVKAWKMEYKRLLRSKLRTISWKTGIGKSGISKKIQYDYFEPI